jgi:hypothetical protein
MLAPSTIEIYLNRVKLFLFLKSFCGTLSFEGNIEPYKDPQGEVR